MIDDLFLVKLPPDAGEELADALLAGQLIDIAEPSLETLSSFGGL
ncbi:MAG: hypothetical protein ACRETD_03075 [Steroidobacteraceae bacterium]